MSFVKEAIFEKSGSRETDIPDDGLCEVVIIGRSNTGKSTLINRLSGRRAIARVSKTPGATKLINSFLLTTTWRSKFRLIDLPGFGFAKASKTEASKLEFVIRSVIEERPSISLLLLLQDIRRTPQYEEKWLQSIAFERSIPLQIVLTKADKETKSKWKFLADGIAKEFGLEGGDLLITGEAIALDPLWERIAQGIDSKR